MKQPPQNGTVDKNDGVDHPHARSTSGILRVEMSSQSCPRTSHHTEKLPAAQTQSLMPPPLSTLYSRR